MGTLLGLSVFVRVKCKFICYSPGTPDPQLMTLWYNLVKCLFRFELLLFCDNIYLPGTPSGEHRPNVWETSPLNCRLNKTPHHLTAETFIKVQHLINES